MITMKEKGCILVVDDEEVNRRVLRKILESEYQVVEAEDGESALKSLLEKDHTVEAIILDIIMPKMDGYAFLEQYRQSDALSNIPVIVSTGDETTENEVKCFELGAWDVVKKPFNTDIIRFRIKNAIERSHLHVLQEMRYREQYDLLTGLYKKEKFIHEANKLLKQHPDTNFAIIRLDIYKFQLFNAFYGRKQGDKLLVFMAELVKRCFQEAKYLICCREEADVFDCCVSEVDRNVLLDCFARARSLLSKYKRDYDIVPVFGVYIVDNKNITVNEMVDRAKLASKECKGNYMKNYAFYEDDLERDIVKEQTIVNNMNSALEKEEFVLYLQPKYDLRTNQIDGAEVLVRWLDPQKGMISPGEFIPVFERNGFIMKLDYYVWEHSCMLLRRWLDEGRKPYPISVNISRVSLYNPNLVEIICGLVEKYRIEPALLQLELTESAYTSNPVAIKEAMGRLREHGFAILMDDFGSGYSSLNVLKDIVVDILKIDMKFMSDCDMPGRSENILASVVRMAKWLNMPVVAEGVEKEEQVSFLKSIGCEYVQGYYFARPMPVKDYEDLAFGDSKFHKDSTKNDGVSKDNLWTSTSQMEILFSNILQAVAVYEYDENQIDVIRVNNAYFDLFGYRDLNSSHESVVECAEESYREKLREAFRYVAATENVADCEFVRELESGKKIWVSLRLKYINKIGNKSIIYGIFTDISEQKRMDEELQKYRDAFDCATKEEQTILIVDDQEINRESLQSIFEEKYRVLTAENGEQAFEVLKENDYQIDIILLDIMMPVMDGPSFLEKRKEIPQLKDMPVIIITADDSPKQQVYTLQLGADDYVVKPFVPEVVIRRVQNVLNSAGHFVESIRGIQADNKEH